MSAFPVPATAGLSTPFAGFAAQIATAIEDARTDARLVELNHAIMKGLHAGAIGDEAAQRLAELIHARRMLARTPETSVGAFRPVGSIFRPRKPQRAPVRAVAIERRRRLAASGPLPPQLAARFTLSEQAVLRIVGDEYREKGACTLTIAAIAARAGVSRTTVQNATRQATREGLLLVQERRQPGALNLPNKITIVSKEWCAWLVRGPRGTGFKKFDPTDTQDGFRPVERAERAAESAIHREHQDSWRRDCSSRPSTCRTTAPGSGRP